MTLSGPLLVLSTVAAAANDGPIPAPEATLRPGLDPKDVSPGIEGFLFTALMVGMAILVIRLMVRSVRRVQQRSPEAEEMLIERHQGHLPPEVRQSGERLDGDSQDRLERMRAKYPGYLSHDTPEPQAPDSGRD